MGIHYLNAVQAVDCIVIHRNPDAEKRILSEGVLTFGFRSDDNRPLVPFECPWCEQPNFNADRLRVNCLQIRTSV